MMVFGIFRMMSNRLADSLEDVALKSGEAMRKTEAEEAARRKSTGVAERPESADAGSYSRKTSRL